MGSRGYFAIGIDHCKTEHNVGSLWRTADLLGARFLFTIGRRYKKRQASDTMCSARHVPLFHFATIEDLRDHLPLGCKLVGVELVDGAADLADHKHFERSCYLLGAEDHGLTKDALGACHELVRLPGRFSMNVAVAGSIVLYDRVAKAACAAKACALETLEMAHAAE